MKDGLLHSDTIVLATERERRSLYNCHPPSTAMV
jgi:hypothetical protein